jgi:DNA polymerase I
MEYVIDNASLNELKAYLKEDNLTYKVVRENSEYVVIELSNEIEVSVLPDLFFKLEQYPSLIYGKNTIEGIVAAEAVNDKIVLFIETKDGIETKHLDNKSWILSSKNYGESFKRLKGNQHYKWIKLYNTLESFDAARRGKGQYDIYTIHNAIESNMISQGFTLFKGLKLEDVSVLSFDIETDGLVHHSESTIYLITNTYRKGNKVIRKLFDFKSFDSQKEMLESWVKWVQEINPSVLIGHNIYGYDLPYIAHCASLSGAKLELGRDLSDLWFNSYESRFRKDATQFYTYHKPNVMGRQVIDTQFLAIKYDIGRKYESYGLKAIIKHEDLEIKDRQFFEAGSIKKHVNNPEQWAKIKKYAEQDADDALKLYDLMIPSFFYLNQYIPKTFESMINQATGSQINSFMVRAYLQEGNSIPKADERADFEGAISLGNPGIYKNVFKVDVASLYPSIILQYSVYDSKKDPEAKFLKMIDYFTKQRLEEKRIAKETGDRYFKDLEQSKKIVINSGYGFMGAEGLNFNSPENASFITRKGREILQTCIDWCNNKGFALVNADTDSISFTLGKEINEEERKQLLAEINAMYPEKIKFEDDGYYPTVCVVKAKNYALWDGNRIKIKGSALKATSKEKALQEFNNRFLMSLLKVPPKDKEVCEDPLDIYNSYVFEITNMSSIDRWCKKVTVTEKVLDPQRTNEQKVLDCIKDKNYSLGDKIYVYFDSKKNIKLAQEWNQDHDIDSLLDKLHSSVEVFESVIDKNLFLNYKLKKNKAELQKLVTEMASNV